MDNIRIAYKKARRNKVRSYGVRLFDMDTENNLVQIQRELMDGSYTTGEYHVFKIYEPKEREISRLDFKHRVVHHAVMNILEPIWVNVFTFDTYSCIKGRGIHQCLEKLKEALKDKPGTTYCLKIDVSKFYPSIDHEILKIIIRRKLKDQKLLILLDGIIDSAVGLPIGNYLSQFFANLQLAYFDHEVKEQIGVKYYFRYCDDMIFLSGSKEALHEILENITIKLSALKLKIKPNYQIFPVDSRGIDFLGYVARHDYILMRKSIKKAFYKKRNNETSVAAYWGWAKHCNSKNLVNTFLKNKDYEFIKRPSRKNTKIGALTLCV